jgi:hypothetical protein
VQDHAADQLHVVVTLAEHAARRFADGRKGGLENAVERRAFGDLLAKFVGARPQCVVTERLELFLHGVDGGDSSAHRLDAAIVC